MPPPLTSPSIRCRAHGRPKPVRASRFPRSLRNRAILYPVQNLARRRPVQGPTRKEAHPHDRDLRPEIRRMRRRRLLHPGRPRRRGRPDLLPRIGRQGLRRGLPRRPGRPRSMALRGSRPSRLRRVSDPSLARARGSAYRARPRAQGGPACEAWRPARPDHAFRTAGRL